MRARFAIICTGLVLMCTACAGVNPPAADLQPPSARLLEPPKPLPDVAKGSELYDSVAQCSAAYVRETGRLRSLQGWVGTVLKK